ncbi:hypothetical protein EBGED10_26970 [Bacillus sp. GeD10]|nr:hypothetical protein EBGED10_26970 [Bacillus sp. GeD10]
MREIKFRVWSKHTEKMFDDGFYISQDGDLFQNDSLDYKNKDSFEVMQYTGSEDKNGRELYELDITKDKFGNLDVICWINSLGAYATVPINLYVEGNYEYTVVDEFGTDCFFKNNVPGDFLEVIGNIYENPELLEESK